MKKSEPITNFMRYFSVVLMLVLCSLVVQANYSLSSVRGKVEVKHGGKVVLAEPGMKVGSADLIILGQDGSVEVLDKRDSKLYRRDQKGEISVLSLIFEAKKEAGSNAGAVHRKVSFGKSSEEEGKMYVEKGKITLALEEYDPAGENFMIDAKVMARYIADVLCAGTPDSLQTFPTTLIHKANAEEGLMFRVDNNVSEPLYINVIKIRVVDNKIQLRISELGQPIGCYVLLPCQSLMRSQCNGGNSDEAHILVATHYYFSIDELIEELGIMLTMQPEQGTSVANLPIYIQKL